MNFKEYQERASGFAEYADEGYPFLGLAEEVGEFIGIVAKAYRGDDMTRHYNTKELFKEHLLKEAGDILWQLSQCLSELGLSLQEAAEINIEKLTERKARGVIKGRGDNR